MLVGDEMNREAWGIVMVAVLLTAVVAVGGTYWWMERQAEETPTAVPTTTVTRVASLDMTIENETFANFSAAIDANGSVSTDAEASTNITIYNNDSIDSGTLYLTFYNEQTTEEGLPDALKIDEVTVKITYASGFQTLTKYLFKDGEFNKINLGSLESEAYATIQITVGVEACDDTTFIDGKTYHCEFYLLQGSTSYEDVDWQFIT